MRLWRELTLSICGKKINKCSNCSRMHSESTKRCPHCKEYTRAHNKRKREAQPDVPDGHKYCTNCGKIHPVDQFIRESPRDERPTAHCKTCRENISRSRKNPNTKSGACREVWMKWKEGKVCKCGETRSIHARGKYRALVHICSGYSWWASNGGTKALKEQLKECYPLCKFCIRLLEPPKTRRPDHQRRHDIINAEKLRLGCCKKCKRKVTPENVSAFDFDHRNRVTKIDHISQMIHYSQEKFDRVYPVEVKRCDLLCCICHDIKTFGRES